VLQLRPNASIAHVLDWLGPCRRRSRSVSTLTPETGLERFPTYGAIFAFDTSMVYLSFAISFNRCNEPGRYYSGWQRHDLPDPGGTFTLTPPAD
jgi:hypothetical protein